MNSVVALMKSLQSYSDDYLTCSVDRSIKADLVTNQMRALSECIRLRNTEYVRAINMNIQVREQLFISVHKVLDYAVKNGDEDLVRVSLMYIEHGINPFKGK